MHVGTGKEIISKVTEVGVLQCSGSGGQRYQNMGRQLKIVASCVCALFLYGKLHFSESICVNMHLLVFWQL